MENPMHRRTRNHIVASGTPAGKITKSEKARLLLGLLDDQKGEAWGAEFIAKLRGLAAEEDPNANLLISKAAADELLELMSLKGKTNSNNCLDAVSFAPTLGHTAAIFQKGIKLASPDSASPKNTQHQLPYSSDAEHPAIIARRIVGFPIQERHRYLKTLDGRLARQVSFALSQFGTRA